MKSCVGCKYADWNLTKAGKLHPSGDGFCRYPYKINELPPAFYWIGKKPPQPCGGVINRKQPLKRDCPYYERKED